MRNHPIPFSGPMVRALLEDRKTQTRRVLTPQPADHIAGFQRVFKDAPHFEALDASGKPVVEAFPDGPQFVKPYPPVRYSLGDKLWVREAWCADLQVDGIRPRDLSRGEPIGYLADGALRETGCMMLARGRNRPGMFMPRWASRMTLTVTDVRVQRVQAISEEDARAEGHPIRPEVSSDQQVHDDAARDWFMDLWDSLNAPRGYGWEANPWVAAYNFTVECRNIDAARDAGA